MRKIAIIGANSFQNPLILKAKEMGYETHVFAWRDGSIGERTADYFYPISIIEKDLILEKCREIRPDAIVTSASDLANITVQYVAVRLGLPCNSEESILISTNKYAMRQALIEYGVAVPRFVKVAIEDDYAAAVRELSYPMIVKPTDRSGSRGITKVNQLEEIPQAVKAAAAESFEKCAIIEEYINGEEYSCEGISYQGAHHLLAITKKYTTGYPHFIETAHLEPAPISETIRNKIQVEIPKALDALKIESGASHSEFKITADGEIRIIEIGSRMGGDCIGSHLVELSTGYDFTKMVIETACGDKPSIKTNQKPRCAGIRFIFSKKDLEIYEDVKEKHPELLQYVSEIEKVGEHEVVDSSTRFGYFIIASESEKIVKELLER
ncbi:MAG: ATP-grasp domain-containing protein [Lachnospiraceae bacterium]|nr:ATP-grasp domain-containing protein [Lachnospiraceae bacterium]